jgi:hypothetical protein
MHARNTDIHTEKINHYNKVVQRILKWVQKFIYLHQFLNDKVFSQFLPCCCLLKKLKPPSNTDLVQY